jgi:hypothetical protein
MKNTWIALCAALVMACGGSDAKSATNTSTSAPGTTKLEGKTYDVVLEGPGEAPAKDQLIFTGTTFESTMCTGFGFKPASYTSQDDSGGTQFTVAEKHPTEPTTVDWKGVVKGDTVEGTATRTMNGKVTVLKFTGKVHQ